MKHVQNFNQNDDPSNALREAMVYMTECTLATVEELSCKKSYSKSESPILLRRQINIVQIGLNQVERSKIHVRGGRVIDIFQNHDGDVERWSDFLKSNS